MNNTENPILTNHKPSEVYGATIMLLKKSMGMSEHQFVNKERTHVMQEVGDYHSDWDEKVRPLTDADQVVLAQIDTLRALEHEAKISETERELASLKSQVTYKEETLARLRQS